MERSDFIRRIAGRLGREPLTIAPERDVTGPPDFYIESPYGEDVDVDRVDRFVTELKALGGETIVVPDNAGAASALRSLFDQLRPSSIITWDRSEFSGWDQDWLWDERGAVSWRLSGEKNHGSEGSPAVVAPDSTETASIAPSLGDLKKAAQGADIGITLADYAVANTGTLALITSPGRARSVSLLPTTHIALLRESQIVDRMGQVLDTFNTWTLSEVPSSIHFISGPSRSSDIENDLTIGVHGPVAVYVVLVRGV